MASTTTGIIENDMQEIIKREKAEKKRKQAFERSQLKITRIDYTIFSDNLQEWDDVRNVNIMANDYYEAERELMKHIPTAVLQKGQFKITSRQENIMSINLISEPVKRRLYEWLSKEFENAK